MENSLADSISDTLPHVQKKDYMNTGTSVRILHRKYSTYALCKSVFTRHKSLEGTIVKREVYFSIVPNTDWTYTMWVQTCAARTQSIDGIKRRHSIPSASRIHIGFFLGWGKSYMYNCTFASVFQLARVSFRIQVYWVQISPKAVYIRSIFGECIASQPCCITLYFPVFHHWEAFLYVPQSLLSCTGELTWFN